LTDVSVMAQKKEPFIFSREQWCVSHHNKQKIISV